MLKKDKRQILFLLLVCYIKYTESAVTQQQIDRICSKGHFNITTQSYNYSTIQEYYDDKYLKIKEKSKDFFLSIITEGKVPSDLSPFIKEISIYIFFIALAGGVILSKINYNLS